MPHPKSGIEGPSGAGAIRAATDRISSSKLFAKSRQLVRLLEFCVERTLEGQASCLKETVLGIEAFDRGTDFDPRIDPIVRVDARRLRQKLNQYYDSEGEAERLRIAFDPGSYVPRFVESAGAAPKRAWPSIRRLAVLPLKSLGRDSESIEFASGLTEDLISALARTAGLQVVARTSVFLFEKECIDLRRAGELLAVGTVIEGSIQSSAQRLRVNIRLAATETGFTFWSHTFDGSLSSVFDMQDEIVRCVCEELRVRVAEGVVRRAGSAEAYRHYLKGLHLYSSRQPDLILKAVVCFESALAIDAAYAPAHAALAQSCGLLSLVAGPPGLVLPRAKQAALRAVELDPQLAEGYAALGMILTGYDWDHSAAAVAAERAVRLSPGTAGIYEWYIVFLASVGRADEALLCMRHAQGLDPLSPLVNSNAGLVLYIARRYEDAIACFEDYLEDDPHNYWLHWHLGMTYLAFGAVGRAIDSFRRASELCEGSHSIRTLIAFGYGLDGRRIEAENALTELTQRTQGQYVCPVALALAYAGLGDRETAFRFIDQAIGERSPLIYWFAWPIFDILRDDARFDAALDSVGFSRG